MRTEAHSLTMCIKKWWQQETKKRRQHTITHAHKNANPIQTQSNLGLFASGFAFFDAREQHFQRAFHKGFQRREHHVSLGHLGCTCIEQGGGGEGACRRWINEQIKIDEERALHVYMPVGMHHFLREKNQMHEENTHKIERQHTPRVLRILVPLHSQTHNYAHAHTRPNTLTQSTNTWALVAVAASPSLMQSTTP